MTVNEEYAEEFEESVPEELDATEQEEADGQGEEEADEQAQSQAVPYERFREVNERQKALRAEVEALKAQMAERKAQPEPSEEELATQYANDPVGFVKEVVKRSGPDSNKEIGDLKQQLATVRYQQMIAEARLRYPDFNEFESDIAGLIEDPETPIDPSKPRALDAYYMLAKSRRRGGQAKKVSTGNKAVPHVESGRKPSRIKRQVDFDKMSLEEMERYIGTADYE